MEGEVLKRLVRLMVGLIGRRCQQDCSGTLRTGDVISVSPANRKLQVDQHFALVSVNGPLTQSI
jgi:ribosomal protein S28E/S33